MGQAAVIARRQLGLEQRLMQFSGAELQLWRADRHHHSSRQAVMRRVQLWLGRVSSAHGNGGLATRIQRQDHSLTHAGNQVWALGMRSGVFKGAGLDFEPWRDLNARHQSLMLTCREHNRMGAASATDLLRIWTVKEACFKADKAGQQHWVTHYELDRPECRLGFARVNNHGRVQRFRYISLPVPGGILSAAFALGEGHHE